MNKYHKVRLDNYFTGIAFTYNDNKEDGNFTVLGASYPSEQLPESNSEFIFNNIPFHFPSKEMKENNHMEFNNQYITVPNDRYHAIHFLGASENGSFKENIFLITENKKYNYKLGLSEWINKEPDFNDMLAIRCQGVHSKTGIITNISTSIWYQKILFDFMDNLIGIEFVDNPGIHIFGLTLERDD